MAKQFLSAEWNNLVMANYIIEPAVLKPYLPANTELDTFNGNTYISLIGFMFEKTRLLGYSIPFHINFEEVNLRFYVRCNSADNEDCKRGVTFIKEFVPKTAISFIANTVYNEKYKRCAMKHFFTKKENEINLGYHWKYKNKWHRLEATAATEALPIQSGSEEEFIAEHYWGYSKYNEHTTYEYAVQHPTWQMYKVNSYVIDCDFKTLYGDDFAFLQNAKPNTVFLAAGSAITVLQKRVILSN